MALALIIALTAPLVAAVVPLARGRRRSSQWNARSGTWSSVLVAASALAAAVLPVPTRNLDPTVVSDHLLRADALTLIVLMLVGVIGLMVQSYAGRNLESDRRAWCFFAGANLVVGGTGLVVSAGRLSTLLVGWMLTSTGVLVLLGYRPDAAARAAARRAAWVLGIGDACLGAASVWCFVLVGDARIDRVASVAHILSRHRIGPIGADEVVALLLIVAAMTRAGQLPFPAWLPGTVALPTPVSAFLHAGVVNAGGLLLVRLGPVLALSKTACSLLAGFAIVTILWSAASLPVRPDVKGALAISTSSQMAFMLLAVAVGAPAIAITHLIGHALYKASRFLGAGAAIEAHSLRRRFSAVKDSVSFASRSMIVLLVVFVVAAEMAVVRPAATQTANWWMTAAVSIGIVARAAWTWPYRPTGSQLPTVVIGFSLLVAAGGYLVLARLVDHALASSLVHKGSGFVAAPLALAMLASLLLAGAVVTRYKPTAGWLTAACGGSYVLDPSFDRRSRKSHASHRFPSLWARPALRAGA